MECENGRSSFRLKTLFLVRSGTDTGSIKEQPQQVGAMGNILPTGLSGEPGAPQESTRGGLLGRLALNSGPQDKEDSSGGGDNGVPVIGVSSDSPFERFQDYMKNQRPGDVLRHNLSFKVMAHLRLDSPLDSNKEQMPAADRRISRERLHAYCGEAKVVKHFLYEASFNQRFKKDVRKRVFISTTVVVCHQLAYGC